MAVFRIERTRDYTVMSNHHLRNEKLSLKAKGLLSMMLSLPDDWNYTTRGLAKICKEGVDAIGGALRELESAGYIVRHQLRDRYGRISDTEYVIYEQPQPKQQQRPDPMDSTGVFFSSLSNHRETVREEQERLEKERQERERLEAQRREQQRLEQQRKEAELREQQRQEQERARLQQEELTDSFFLEQQPADRLKVLFPLLLEKLGVFFPFFLEKLGSFRPPLLSSLLEQRLLMSLLIVLGKDHLSHLPSVLEQKFFQYI